MKFNFDSVYWVIARIGGFDGVSLQTLEYIKLLNETGITVRLVTGEKEKAYGPVDYKNNAISLVKRLGFNHYDSRYLYNHSFINKKSDTKAVKKIMLKTVFDKHKKEIKKALEKELSKEEKSPVIIHNLLSLRHLHPAAAAG